MSIVYQQDGITIYPFRKEIDSYTLETFKSDLFAAFNVCLLTIPQSLAYAMLAGLPLVCGLFAAIFSSCVAALFGSSRHMIVGPSNAIAILIQAGISQVVYTYYRHLPSDEIALMSVHVLTQLVVLTAAFQILAALCKLGRLIHFVSHSVIVGYLAGTAFAIMINQAFNAVGIDRMAGVRSLYEHGIYLLSHLHLMHIPTALVGAGSFALIFLLKRINKRMPAALITFIVSSLIVMAFDLSSEDFVGSGEIDPYADERVTQVLLIGNAGRMFDFLPQLSIPYFDTGIMNELLPVAFALALLSVMETTSVAKSLAASTGQRLSTNQEIFGIGFGNLVSAFVGGMPISGSPSRSAFNYFSGAKTRFAAVYGAAAVGVLVLLLGDLIGKIPLATLAALLMYSAANVVNFKQFSLCLKATSSDAFVLWMTFLSCIFFSFDVAFYIGIVISIILYLKKAAVPLLVEYEVDEQGELVNIAYGKISTEKAIRVIKVEGELFFGAADLFQTALKAFAEDDNSTKVIILQLKNTRDMDATACLALQQLHDYLKKSNRLLICCGITPTLWEVLSDSGFVKLIGKENLYIFDEKHPHLYMQKSFHRAKRFLCAQKPVIENETFPISSTTISNTISSN